MNPPTTRFAQLVLAAICGGCAAEEAVSPSDVRLMAIAFNARTASLVWDIYTIDPGGSGLRNVTNTPDEDLYPAWSPDHRQIAYYSKGIPEGIYVINADGTGRRLVAMVDDVGHLAWSPDGTRLAFHASIGSVFGVHVVPATGDSSVPQRLSTSPTGWSPSWSPDGKYIAYASGPGYGSEIYVIESTGKNRKNITSSWGELTGEVDPVWSPDGKQIAFARFSGPGVGMGVWVMNADGTSPRQIVQGHDRVPAWSPDGSNLVVQRPNVGSTVLLCILRVAERRLGHCLTPEALPVAGHPSW